MNNIKKVYNKKEWNMFIFNIIIYIIFIGFTLSLALQQSTLLESLPFILLLIFFLGFSILNDFLRYLYKVCIYTLTTSCDPSKTQHEINRLKKLDIFKSYRLSIYMLTCLALLDELKMKEAIDYVQNNESSNNHKDKVLLDQFVLFRAHAFLGNTKFARVHYEKLKEIRDVTAKGKRVSPLFSFEDIEGCYHLLDNNPKKAWLSLQRTNTKALNPRELTDHYGLRVACELKLDNLNQAKHYLQCFPTTEKPSKLKSHWESEVIDYEKSTKRRQSKTSRHP